MSPGRHLNTLGIAALSLPNCRKTSWRKLNDTKRTISTYRVVWSGTSPRITVESGLGDGRDIDGLIVALAGDGRVDLGIVTGSGIRDGNVPEKDTNKREGGIADGYTGVVREGAISEEAVEVVGIHIREGEIAGRSVWYTDLRYSTIEYPRPAICHLPFHSSSSYPVILWAARGPSFPHL